MAAGLLKGTVVFLGWFREAFCREAICLLIIFPLLLPPCLILVHERQGASCKSKRAEKMWRENNGDKESMLDAQTQMH